MRPTVIPSPPTAVWHLGPLPIRAYALCILTGVVVAVVLTDLRLRRTGAPRWSVADIAMWAVPAGIIGARLYHLATDPELYFTPGRHPLDALKIWNGGLGIWGAVVGGALGAWIGCRRAGIPLTVLADALAPVLPIAQAIGRLGNYFNQELFGRPTNLPWALAIDPAHRPAGYGQYPTFHPTFAYEIAWNLGVAVLVWAAQRRWHLRHGRAFALYVMAYVTGRFWIEDLRIDTANHILGLRLNDWTCLIVFAAALAFFLRAAGSRRQPHDQPPVDDPHRATPGPAHRPTDAPSAPEPASSSSFTDDTASGHAARIGLEAP